MKDGVEGPVVSMVEETYTQRIGEEFLAKEPTWKTKI